MLKAEIDRKMFLMKLIPYFSEIPKSRFDQLYKHFIPRFLAKNEIIYLENTPADTIYVIYLGQCQIEKNTQSKPHQNDYRDPSKQLMLMTLDRGDLAGLEALESYHYLGNYKSFEERDIKYRFSLKSTDDNTVLISIKMSFLNETREGLIKGLNTLKIQKEKLLLEIFHKKIATKMKTKPVFREEILNKQLRDIQRGERKIEDENIKNCIKNCRKGIIPKNNFKIQDLKLNQDYIKRKVELSKTTYIDKEKENKKMTRYPEIINVFDEDFYNKVKQNQNFKKEDTLKEKEKRKEEF